MGHWKVERFEYKLGKYDFIDLAKDYNEFGMRESLAGEIYRVSQEEFARLREGVPYVKVYRFNPKHLCPNLNRYGNNGQRKMWSSCGSSHCTC